MRTPPAQPPFEPTDRRVLLIGWDAADWRVARPLMDEGKMPALKRMVDEGASGNLATLRPALSPMLWTSIATGKRPFKHGIHGFMEPAPDDGGVRPITNLSRQTKAIWNMLTQVGKRSNVVGWWPSHPAEPINGVMVSNSYQRATAPKDEPWPMPAGTVHPESLATHLAEFRFHPGEIHAGHLLPFIPSLKDIDPTEDERVSMCARTIADTTSIHGAATALMQLEPWDFMGVYYDGIDHFGHGFMRYHPPKQAHISDEDFERYSSVVEAAYRWHDQLLGALLKLAGPETTVILISDHGFHPDHMRPAQLPIEPAGPAAEHRHYGIIAACGPGIASGPVFGASILDVCPTLLTLFGLPVGEDMDGKPLHTLLESAPAAAATIPSWDEVEGEAGLHPAGTALDPQQQDEAIRQLVALGYIDEPDPDKAKARDECLRELRYNLAVAYADAGRHADAAKILEQLWSTWPREHRFGIQLMASLGALGMTTRRRETLDKLTEQTHRFAREARREFRQLRPQLQAYRPAGPKPEQERDSEDKRAPMPRDLQFKARQLAALSSMRPTLLRWLHATQALAEGKAEESLSLLERLKQRGGDTPAFHIQLARGYSSLQRWDEAESAYNDALEIDAENADAKLGMAEVLIATGRFEAAIDAGLSATELVFQNPRAHLTLARALAAAGERKPAITAAEVALAQAPGYAEAHVLLAEISDEPQAQLEHQRRARQTRQDAAWRQTMQAGTLAETPTAPEDWFAPSAGDDHGWIDLPASSVITIVSGLPRSGTSMMMQMLAAGGIPPHADTDRLADEDNPAGYLEYRPVKALATDAAWIPQARGHCLKVVAPLLKHLPPSEHYQVIFIERDPREVIASQQQMLARSGREGSALGDSDLIKALGSQARSSRTNLADRTDVRVRYVRFSDAVNRPVAVAQMLRQFLGRELNAEAAARAVDQSLYRQRR